MVWIKAPRSSNRANSGPRSALGPQRYALLAHPNVWQPKRFHGGCQAMGTRQRLVAVEVLDQPSGSRRSSRERRVWMPETETRVSVIFGMVQ
jgi:hypothetical protein